MAEEPWELLLNFDWSEHLVECPSVLTTNGNLQKGVILCIVIMDVDQLIGHWPIPFDPWNEMPAGGNRWRYVTQKLAKQQSNPLTWS